MAETYSEAKKRGGLPFLATALMFVLTHAEFRKLVQMGRQGASPKIK